MTVRFHNGAHLPRDILKPERHPRTCLLLYWTGGGYRHIGRFSIASDRSICCFIKESSQRMFFLREAADLKLAVEFLQSIYLLAVFPKKMGCISPCFRLWSFLSFMGATPHFSPHKFATLAMNRLSETYSLHTHRGLL